MHSCETKTKPAPHPRAVQEMHMPNNVVEFNDSAQVQSSRSALDELLRTGAQQILQAAIQNEVAEYIQAHASLLDQKGRRLVVRNGYLPERELQSPLGNVSIRQPRVDDRRPDHKFLSRLLPPYLRRTPTLESVIPALYLRGISTGDFTAALASLLDRMRRDSRQRISSASRKAGPKTSKPGAGGIFRASVTSAGGPMAFTSMCAWTTPPGPACGSSWEPWKMGRRSSLRWWTGSARASSPGKHS